MMKMKYFLFSFLFLLIMLFAFQFTKEINHNESQNVFSDQTTSLSQKGYSKEEINEIYKYLKEEDMDWILKNDYIDLNGYLEISNFRLKNYDRYKAYEQISELSKEEIVTFVNLRLDKPFYSDITEIQNPNDITVLVNKYHALSPTYEPEDLVSIPSFPHLKLRSVAIEDFERLLDAAKKDNVFLVPYSTYRSYDYQKGLYEKYLQNDPLDVVDTYSARPGHSEHQTGLAIDIRSEEHWYSLTPKDYEWMKNHSYLYGFIIRYTKDAKKITGYKEEPWHIRYIGVEHATKIHNLGITFDEYYDKYLTKE